MFKYIVIARKWFDKVNGNTYHAVKVTRISDGKTYTSKREYGYGCQYEVTAKDLIRDNTGIIAKQSEIFWHVEDNCKKRDLNF